MSAAGPAELKLELASTRDEIGRALDELRQSCASWGVADEIQDDLCLAADEVLANVVLHGYGEGGDGRIHLLLGFADAALTLEVRDRAAAFDPLAAAAPALGEARDAAQIGGLGIHLVRSVMDSVTYARVEGENRLTLVRRVRAIELGGENEGG